MNVYRERFYEVSGQVSIRWNVNGFDRAVAVGLCREGVNPLTAVVMASRGVTTRREMEETLAQELSAISDPMLMRDMPAAVDRVRRAIAQGEHVAVYGDYDVDGITASCLVAGYLREKGLVCDIYIPERLEEGYGVNSAALDTVRSRGASLVITVDCGITAVAEARHAREIGLDLVITDHHEQGQKLPDAIASLDPKRPDCPCPAKGLAGVGVAFKLVCAVEGPGSEERMLEKYADLVATGTIADVMPVTGENRILIQRGLEMIRAGGRPGLAALRTASGMDGKAPTVGNVGFAIAPRINAAGRLGSTDVAVELLTTRDPRRAQVLAEELCALNRERQRLEGEMFRQAAQMLDGHPPEGPIVLASDRWHQGVCGIVASRVAERYSLPAVMICVKDGLGRGSCRSMPGFNIFEAIASCRELLINFGGHEMAAGLTMAEENIDALRQALGRIWREGPKPPERVLNIDLEVIKPEILSIPNLEALDRLEPYGPGNPQPVLCMRDVCVENAAALSEGKHTKLWLSKRGQVFEAVYFSKGPEALGVRAGGMADVAFTPQINEFRGRRCVQLCLADFVPRD